MNKLRALKVYESECRRIEVKELLTEMKLRNKSTRGLCRVMGWDRTYFRRCIKTKRFYEIHSADLETLLNFLEKSDS